MKYSEYLNKLADAYEQFGKAYPEAMSKNSIYLCYLLAPIMCFKPEVAIRADNPFILEYVEHKNRLLDCIEHLQHDSGRQFVGYLRRLYKDNYTHGVNELRVRWLRGEATRIHSLGE